MKLFNKSKAKNVPDRYMCFDKMNYYYEKALENYLYLKSKKENELTKEDMLEIECIAGNHIGFFISWIILNHYEGSIHNENIDLLEAVRNEEILGIDFLLECCDGKLTGEDLCDSIVPFVNSYYNKSFMSDYGSWVINELYYLPLEFVGTWEEYHRFEPILDHAYQRYI